MFFALSRLAAGLCLALGALAQAAPQGSEAPGVWLCPRAWPARLSPGSSCEARVSLQGQGQSGDLCLSSVLWSAWIAEGALPPGCGLWKGHWQAYSPPVNSTLDKKQVRFKFIVTQLPQAKNPSWVRLAISRLDRFRERVSKQLEPWDPDGYSRLLLLGAKTNPDGEGLLRELGFFHLVTTTGIHLYAVSAAIGAVFLGVASIGGIETGLALGLSRAFSVLSWLLAWCLSGMRPGMLRPVFMVLCRETSRQLGWRWRAWTPLAISIALDLGVGWVLSPVGSSILDWAPGRLSYALAVGGGWLGMESCRPYLARNLATRNPGAGFGWLKRHSLQHSSLAIGSWGFLALFECACQGHLATLGPVMSLLTIPVIASLIYPALLAGSLGSALGIHYLQQSLFWLASSAMAFQVSVLARVALAVADFWVIPLWALAIGAGIGALSLGLRGRARIIALGVPSLLICLTRLIFSDAQSTRAYDRVEQLDVGQGDSAMLSDRCGARAALVDSGAEKALSPSAWLSILAQRKASHLDWVALTHLDEDHAGGVRRIASILPVGQVVTSRQEWETPRGQALAAYLRARGVWALSWEEAKLRLAALPPPDVQKLRRGQARGNSRMSAVLVSLSKSTEFLSMGDADSQQEVRMSKWALSLRDPKKALILKVSHHGAGASTSSDLLEELKPDVAWISDGIGNLYGHPSIATLMRLRNAGVPIRRTDEQGFISSDEEIRAGGVRRPR